MNIDIKKANVESFSYIKGMRTGQEYRFCNNMYAVLDPDIESPLSCVSVANNSLSIDLWTGCSFQCAYCHVQGIKEDIADDGCMRVTPIRRNKFSIDQIISKLIEHPFFRKDKTVISIATSCTEPFTTGEVLESTLEIMENFISRGFKNPFWIVTKAGIPKVAVDRLNSISNKINKLIISICWANNPKEIEPIQNNRFKNIELLTDKNTSINWYMRPMAKEWLGGIDKLENIFKDTSEKYSKYIDSIVPGGLRWTEGIEYGMVEVRGLSLPNISKENNTKTLNDDDWNIIMDLSKKYFPDKPIFYHSSCALSLAMETSNISMTNFHKKSDCNKSCCTSKQKSRCSLKSNVTHNNIQSVLNNVGFGIKVLSFNSENGFISTKPDFNSLTPALQQEIYHAIALLNNDTPEENKITSILNKNETLKTVLNILTTCDTLNSVSLVGSAQFSDNPQDIDLLVLINSEKNNIEALKIVENKLQKYITSKCDDSLRITPESGLEINLAVYDYNNFSDKLTNIIENKQFFGEHRSWCLGYWLPEILIKDILESSILYEVDTNNFSKLKSYVSENKIELLEHIEEDCLTELEFLLNRIIKKHNTMFDFNLIKTSLILALSRFGFIKTGIAGTSYKRFDLLMNKDVWSSEEFEKLQHSSDPNQIVESTNIIIDRLTGGCHEEIVSGHLAI